MVHPLKKAISYQVKRIEADFYAGRISKREALRRLRKLQVVALDAIIKIAEYPTKSNNGND